MIDLKRYIGKKIKVEQVWCGRLQISEGVLKKVIDFRSIFISTEAMNMEIPFAGYCSGIKRIMIVSENEVIYDNPSIPSDYKAEKEFRGFEQDSIFFDLSDDFLPK